MSKLPKSRFWLSCLCGALLLLGAGCGGAEQAPSAERAPSDERAVNAEQATDASQAGEAQAATSSVASEEMPVPALRTNEAGAVIVTQEEVVRMIAAGTAPTILDVRTPEEFAEGHVPGAINISHDQLADRLAEIEASKEDEVIVYCRSGRRAGIAEQLLLDQGFRNVQHLEGDMLAWLEANRPTEKQQ